MVAAKWKQRILELRLALEQYGSHKKGCHVLTWGKYTVEVQKKQLDPRVLPIRCTCGFDQARGYEGVTYAKGRMMQEQGNAGAKVTKG